MIKSFIYIILFVVFQQSYAQPTVPLPKGDYDFRLRVKQIHQFLDRFNNEDEEFKKFV